MNVLLIQVLCRDVLQPDVPDLRYTRQCEDAINLGGERRRTIASVRYDLLMIESL